MRCRCILYKVNTSKTQIFYQYSAYYFHGFINISLRRIMKLSSNSNIRNVKFIPVKNRKCTSIVAYGSIITVPMLISDIYFKFNFLLKSIKHYCIS